MRAFLLEKYMKTHYLNVGQRQHFLQKGEKSSISKIEAEILLNNINSASFKLFKNVVLLVAKKGYLALGFLIPRECLKKKVQGLSKSYLSRLLSATEIYLKLDSDLTYIDKVSENTFRLLANIDNDDAKVIWNKVLETYDGKTISSKNVQRAMNMLNIETKKTLDYTYNVNDELKKNITKYAQRMGEILILPNVQNKDEWNQLAKIFYQQLKNEFPQTQKRA